MVDERCCRGDWSAPKSEASNAAVAVQRLVVEWIHALKWCLPLMASSSRAILDYATWSYNALWVEVNPGKPKVGFWDINTRRWIGCDKGR